MAIEILNKKSKYYKKLVQFKTFISQIERICILHRGYELQANVVNVHKYQALRIAKAYAHILIKNRLTMDKYTGKDEIVYPTVTSFLYDDRCGEIFISIATIAQKHNKPTKQINQEIKIYLAHSICNLYMVSNKIYLYIIKVLDT